MDKNLLSNRVADAVYNAREKYMSGFFGFCDEQEQSRLNDILRQLGFKDFLFWGGYSDAERKCLGIFPGTPSAENFPIRFLEILSDRFYTPSHRDYMGSILGTGIKREILGDILAIEEHTAYAAVFDQDNMAQYLCNEITKIGRASVKCRLMPEDFVPQYRRAFELLNFTVSSMRLDSIVAGAVNTSRSVATEMIKEGQVTLNYSPALHPDAQLKCGDVFSVHKKGKFVLLEDGGLTKKDKVRVNIKKYL